MGKLNCKPRFATLIAAGIFLLLAYSAGLYLLRSRVVTIELENGNLQVRREYELPQPKTSRNTVRVIRDITVFDSDSFRIEHGLTCGGKIVEKPTSIYLTLRVPFRIKDKGKLVIADPNEGGGIPLEVFRRLVLMLPSRSKAIQLLSIHDLRGRVQINTPKEALAFCRLATSPATYYYLDGSGVEVVSKDQANLGFFFGDKGARSLWCSTKCIGIMGVLETKSDLNHFKVCQATVKKVTKGFEIKRTLLVEKPKLRSDWLIDVVENVDRDGSYSRRVVRERKLCYDPAYDMMIGYFM